MDNRHSNSSLLSLFSRGATPPIHQQQQQQQQQPQPAPQPQQQAASTISSQSTSSLDTLFQHLDQEPRTAQQSQVDLSVTAKMYPHNVEPYGPVSTSIHTSSGPTTPSMSLIDEPGHILSPVATNAERQSALLSLLGGSSPANNRPAQPPVAPSLPQQQSQIPSPPGSRKSDPSPNHNEMQGKYLLEQLMSGNPIQSQYRDSPPQQSSLPPPSSSSSYAPQPADDYSQYMHQDPAIAIAERSQPSQMPSSVPPSQVSLPMSPSMHPQQHPPSPPRPLFEFISPFDALSSSSGSMRKKNGPQQPSTVSSSGNEDSSTSWTVVSDPKRHSVDNLLDTLTRGAPSNLSSTPPQQQQQAPPPPAAPSNYDPYLSGPDYAQLEEARVPAAMPVVPKASPPYYARPASPRSLPASKPPVVSNMGRSGPGRFNDSPASQSGASQGPPGNGRRDKESSPGPRGGRNRGGAPKSTQIVKRQSSPPLQMQSITFDVSQRHPEIQAASDFVRFTPIALVRQEFAFVPGTTIGATHWVAYSMTKGRVRVISRSSGDRTLLQLPGVFPPQSQVTDMAVFGDRLTGVTSDGGLVVWELPDVITDDVPGRLLLCIGPSLHEDEALKAVRWHPREPDMLAVSSESQIHVIDLASIQMFENQALTQADLPNISQSTIQVNSPIAAFDWDIAHYALATITVDSSLTIWNIQDQLPFSTHKVRGDDTPTSLTFVDGGLVIGRKNGTIFQLLSITNKVILSTVKFVNGSQEDPEMFGHARYDSKIQTLWVANSKRESMIALKINLESSMVDGEDAIRGYFEQIIEFSGPKPSIHFVILTADADPTGEEAAAACVAAKLNPGELALVAFSVHPSGVDQIVVRKEWFETSLVSTVAKFPQYSPSAPVPVSQPAPPTVISEHKPPRQLPAAPQHIRTPPSEEVEQEVTPREEPRVEPKNRPNKGKKVDFKDKDDKDRTVKAAEPSAINESVLSQALSREMKKTEENLHNRIGRLINKEMDRQNQRMDEARAADQQQEFSRQETILKLISTELTRNTTRVVEQSVKSVVHNQVLPALENATRAEVKAAVEDQIANGLIDVISQNLPGQIEKLLLRPDISGHFSRLIGAQLTPVVERHVSDTFAKSIGQKTTIQHQELVHEVRGEMSKLKTDLASWQTDSYRSQESSIRELERSVRALSEQVKMLAAPIPQQQHQQLQHQQQQQQPHQSPRRTSPVPSLIHNQGPMTGMRGPPSIQQSNGPLPSSSYMNTYNFPPPQAPPPVQQNWHPSIVAPQASHPATIPQPPPSERERSPSIKPDQWDDIYLGVLHTQDTNKLRELLSQSNPDLILPLNGPALVSQAVILTLVHRLSSIVGDAVGETPQSDEAFKTCLWWLQRSVNVLRPEDKLITDFIPRVLPNVQALLNTTNRRLAILPVGPQTRETARALSEIQDNLRRKVMT